MLKKPLLALVFLLISGGSNAYDFQALADRHVLPRYQALKTTTAALQESAVAFCEQPEGADLEPLRSRFRDAFLAWQDIQHLRFGPVQYLSREHRFEFWPDKSGAVGKHLARLMADPAIDDGTPLDISQKSVAVQGFSALERLIFDEDRPDTRKCRVVTAIAGNLRGMGSHLWRDWQTAEEPYQAFLREPGPRNPIFDSEEELAGQLLNSLHTQLEFVATEKLGRPLGKGLKKARGKRAEAWRSGLSLPAIAHNLRACRSLYSVTFAPELKAPSLGHRIEAAFEQAERALSEIQPPLSQAVADAGQRKHVERLREDVSRINEQVARELAPALGLSLGFNSLDGD